MVTMQPLQRIYVYDATRIIQEWVDKGKTFSWKLPPEYVIGQLLWLAKTNNSAMIDYHEAVKILQKAETTKMIGDANAGMEWIKIEWRKFKCQVSQ